MIKPRRIQAPLEDFRYYPRLDSSARSPGTIANSPPPIPDFIGRLILTANSAEASYSPQVDITALTIRRFGADKRLFSKARSQSIPLPTVMQDLSRGQIMVVIIAF